METHAPPSCLLASGPEHLIQSNDNHSGQSSISKHAAPQSAAGVMPLGTCQDKSLAAEIMMANCGPGFHAGVFVQRLLP